MDGILLLKAAALGLVEGATEFIPVSSTGHLILAGEALGFTGERAKSFEVFIQLGAILAVLWAYRTKFAQVAAGARRDPLARSLLANVAVAVLPAAAAGFVLHDWIKTFLFQPVTVAAALVVGGLGILAVERWHRPSRLDDVDRLPLPTAFGIGLCQVLSLFPGVSRSGATIMGGLGLGLSRTAATEFSFFLAVPVMLAATGFDLWTSRAALSSADAAPFAVGFVVSFLSALVVIHVLLRFVARHTFRPFAWYRIAVGLLLLSVWTFTS